MGLIKLLIGNFLFVLGRVKIRGFVDSLKAFYISTFLLLKPNEHYYDLWHKINLKFLRNNILPLLDIDIHNVNPVNVSEYKIWTVWWQGINNMPPIIKATYESMQNATNKEVVLITKDNISDYIDIPQYIRNNKNICLAHLSDYIRVALLCKYGGLWIDSTVYCSGKIPLWMFEQSFFTIKASSKSHKYIPMGKWNMQILGSNKTNCPVFVFMKEYLEEYWKKYDKALDYLFFDYGMEIFYENNMECKKLIDNVPYSNEHMHELLPILNDDYDENKYSLMCRDTNFFKLTYKLKFKDINSMSYYARIINE